ncbi:MAG: DMT family transporter [Moorellaceae bacterium]
MRVKHLLALILLALIWGLNFPAMKMGSHYLPPLLFAAGRFFLGALFLFPLAVIRQGRIWHTKRDFGPLLVYGILQTVFMGGGLHLGISLIKSSITSIVLYTYPFFFTFFAYLLLREPLTGKQIAGLIIGFAGLIVVVHPWNIAIGEVNYTGILILLLASIGWGLASVYLKAVLKTYDQLIVTTYQMFYGSLILFIVGAVTEPWRQVSWTLPCLGIMLYTALIASALGFYILLTVQVRYPASQTSVFLFLVPVFGVLFSSLFLKEELTINVILGLILVAAGIIVVSLGSLQQEQTQYKLENKIKPG